MLNKEHITRGEAIVEENTVCVRVGKILYRPEANISDFKGYEEFEKTTEIEAEANAAFIAEAFNVLSETDKTPRELINDFKATEEALLAFFEYALDYIPKADIERFKKLLNK